MTPNSRSYLNRWTSPDAIIPDPGNPLDWDRYSYVRNNPIKYNDPSGHCAWDLCIGETAAAITLGPVLVVTGLATITVGVIAYTTNPTVRAGIDQATSNLVETAERAVNDSLDNLRSFSKATTPKPLTKDEQEKLDHLNNELDGFLDEHPDIAEEAQRKMDGEELDYDHVGELEDFMRGVENDINHLQQIRRSRNDEAQKVIDEAIKNGQKWLQRAKKLLGGEE